MSAKVSGTPKVVTITTPLPSYLKPVFLQPPHLESSISPPAEFSCCRCVTNVFKMIGSCFCRCISWICSCFYTPTPFVPGQPVGLENASMDCWANSLGQLCVAFPESYGRAVSHIPEFAAFIQNYNEAQAQEQFVAYAASSRSLRLALHAKAPQTILASSGQQVDCSEALHLAMDRADDEANKPLREAIHLAWQEVLNRINPAIDAEVEEKKQIMNQIPKELLTTLATALQETGTFPEMEELDQEVLEAIRWNDTMYRAVQEVRGTITKAIGSEQPLQESEALRWALDTINPREEVSMEMVLQAISEQVNQIVQKIPSLQSEGASEAPFFIMKETLEYADGDTSVNWTARLSVIVHLPEVIPSFEELVAPCFFEGSITMYKAHKETGITKEVNAEKSCRFLRAPQELLFHMGRSRNHLGKREDLIPVPATYKLPSAYVVDGQGADYACDFLIEHTGPSMDSGHYVTYRKLADGTWWRISDSSVRAVTEEEAAAARTRAYLIHYSRTV
jgi:hypothetical protein